MYCGMNVREVDDLKVDDYTDACLRAHEGANLDASPEVVFEKIADHASSKNWMPLMDDSSMDQTESKTPGQTDEGSIRICVAMGVELKERIVFWDPPNSFAWQMLPGYGRMKGHWGIFCVEAQEDGGCLAHTFVYFKRASWHPATFIMPFVVRWILKKTYKKLVAEYGGKIVNLC